MVDQYRSSNNTWIVTIVISIIILIGVYYYFVDFAPRINQPNRPPTVEKPAEKIIPQQSDLK